MLQHISEGSRTQKVKYCVIHFIENVRNRQIQRDRKQINGYGAGGGRNGSDYFYGYRFPFGVKIFCSWIGGVVAPHHGECTECQEW